MLSEVKNNYYHCFEDEFCHLQGEFKEWFGNKVLSRHCFFLDDKMHGEYKTFWLDGEVLCHCFYVHGKKVSFDEIPYPTTPEDRMYFMLKYGLPLLPVESVC